MVTVALAVLVVVLVVVGAVVAKLTWRSGRDELHSVDHYRSALGTIAEIRERAASSSVRIVDPEQAGTPTTGAAAAPPDGAGAGPDGDLGDEVPEPEGHRARPVRPDDLGQVRPSLSADQPLVFDDTAPPGASGALGPAEASGALGPPSAGMSGAFGTDRVSRGFGEPGSHDAVDPSGGFRSPRAQAHALHSMNHRSRRILPVASVAVVVVVVAVVAVLVGHGTHRGRPTSSRAIVTTPVSRASGGTLRSKHHRRGSSTSTSTTTTTVPAQVTPVSVGSGGTTANYPVPGTGAFTVTVAASAPCWIDATEASSGSVLWTGTLQAGSSQSIRSPGTLSLELGAPGATLTVDGTPVSFPPGMHTPFVATFVASGSGTSAAGSAG
ncbi:MAG: DUF4115 domain-containing protein [Acidimicrobiales bacterium]